ncbi:hypothetical protein MNBD_BACTEROID01-1930 [hydrothermal vent metagenome]|uniref:SHOCT domain-containing protein n=1 Tax=hydrothermal vent metagenome TaxID=652676 RepID=A0A3B0UBU5_9ZZZZ
MHGINGMSWGMGLGWIISIVILVVLIWFFTKIISSGNNSLQNKKSALDILNERYARGEIGKEEYEGIKKNIL